MVFTTDEFRKYIKTKHIARVKILDAYMEENPKIEYCYEDVDAVYQREVNAQIGAHTIGRSRQSRVNCGHGATRTMNGTKYDRAIIMEDENHFIEFGSFYSESENTEPCFYDSEDKPFKAVRWFDYF